MERLASRWLWATAIVLLTSQVYAQQGETPDPEPAPAGEVPAPSTSTVSSAETTPATAPPAKEVPAPAAEPAPVVAAPAPAPTPTAATRTPSRFSGTAGTSTQASATPAPRADYTYAADAEADDGYRSYEEPLDDAMDDPMDSGLAIRAGVEFQGARRFGSLTRQVLGSELIADGITQQTGMMIDPNAYIATPEDFVIPSSEDFQLAAGLNLGGLIFYRLEGIATFGTLTSLGAFNALGLCLPFGQVYLSIAIGGRASWMMHPELEGGVSLAGRVPVDLTIYVAPEFALFLEGGMGWGVDIVKVRGVDDIATANTATFDLSAGIRFP